MTTPLEQRGSLGAHAVGDLTDATRRTSCEPSASVPSPELRSLVNQTVELVLAHLWDGGVLVPEVLTVGHGDPRQSLMPVVADSRMFGDHRKIDTDICGAHQKARRFVDGLTPERCRRYVWAFDGYVGAQHSEAVIVEAAEAGEQSSWRLAARYRFSKSGISLLDRDLIVIENVHTPYSSR